MDDGEILIEGIHVLFSGSNQADVELLRRLVSRVKVRAFFQTGMDAAIAAHSHLRKHPEEKVGVVELIVRKI